MDVTGCAFTCGMFKRKYTRLSYPPCLQLSHLSLNQSNQIKSNNLPINQSINQSIVTRFGMN